MRCAILIALMTVSCATSPRSADAIDGLMREYEGTNPGASVLVMRGDDVVFRRSYGMANIEEGEKSTPSTHYRLASVTKQFTAALIMILVERGDLSYDDSIRRSFPSLPEWAEGMTIRHLLTHSSGIVDYEDIIPEGTTKQLTDVDVLRLLEGEKTRYFAPGSAYRYSNSGYALLALIVERASHLSFADSLRRNVFTPAGMRTAVAHQEGISNVPDRAYGYSREGTRWTRADQSLTSAVLGDGGIYASIDDMAQWMRYLNTGKFAAAMEPRVDTDDAGVRYGFGWRISADSVGHTGETRGFRNAMLRTRGVSVVILTNRNEGEPRAIAMKIAEMF